MVLLVYTISDKYNEKGGFAMKNKLAKVALSCGILLSSMSVMSNQEAKAYTDDWRYMTDWNLMSHNANYSTVEEMNLKPTYKVGDRLDFIFKTNEKINDKAILKVYKVNDGYGSLRRYKTLELSDIIHYEHGTFLVSTNYKIEKGFPTGEYTFVIKVNNSFYHSEKVNIIN